MSKNVIYNENLMSGASKRDASGKDIARHFNAIENGYLPNTRVAVADNLASRGEATEEVITYRKTGGTHAIEEGNANIALVKGRTLVWNQQNYEVTKKYSYYGGNNVSGHYFSVKKDRYYLYAVMIVLTKGTSASYVQNTHLNSLFKGVVSGPINWKTGVNLFSEVVECVDSGTDRMGQGLRSYEPSADVECYTTNEILIDLTSVYGSNDRIPEELIGRNSNRSIANVFTQKMFGVNLIDCFAKDESGQPLNENLYNLFSIQHSNVLLNNQANGIKTTGTNEDGTTWESIRSFEETRKKYFPEGLKKVGSVFDEIGNKKAAKRIGIATFDGTENWQIHDVSKTFYVGALPSTFPTKGKVLAAGYKDCGFNVPADKEICLQDIFGWRTFNIKDLTYADVAAWKAHLADLASKGTPFTLYYELATYEEYTYDELNLSYKVVPNGTEEIVTDEGVLSTPLVADIVYGIDAYGTIKRNKEKVEELEAKPAISLTADEVTKLRELINTSTQMEDNVNLNYN